MYVFIILTYHKKAAFSLADKYTLLRATRQPQNNAVPLQADHAFVKEPRVTRNSFYNSFPVLTASWRLRTLNFAL